MSARLLTLAAIATAALAMPIVENLHDRAYYEEKFFNWLSQHKIEATSGDHFVKMIQNFANNDDFITQTNNQNMSYKLAHNQFSHMDVDEWRAFVKLGLGKPVSAPGEPQVLTDEVFASSVDWRTSGAVTAVKDQGQCGSCWSFSTTGALEGASKIKYGSLVSLSEQNLVDCDTVDKGCNGGWMDDAFTWVKGNGGICTESAYGYTAAKGSCKQSSCTKQANSAPKSFTDAAVSDAGLVAALNKGPVSVAIEADQRAFQMYSSGVFTGTCGTNLDHGVLAVGYNANAWIVKNSWGTSWGDAGYIQLARGSQYNGNNGQCGVQMAASYPNM